MSIRSSAAGVAVMAFLAACFPSTHAYLRIPIRHETEASHPDRVVVDVSLAELAARMDAFEVDGLAIYGGGRAPRPFRLVDTDGDGAVDHARVEVDVGAQGGGTSVVVTSPGPVAAGDAPSEDAAPTRGIVLDYAQSRR